MRKCIIAITVGVVVHPLSMLPLAVDHSFPNCSDAEFTWSFCGIPFSTPLAWYPYKQIASSTIARMAGARKNKQRLHNDENIIKVNVSTLSIRCKILRISGSL